MLNSYCYSLMVTTLIFKSHQSKASCQQVDGLLIVVTCPAVTSARRQYGSNDTFSTLRIISSGSTIDLTRQVSVTLCDPKTQVDKYHHRLVLLLFWDVCLFNVGHFSLVYATHIRSN